MLKRLVMVLIVLIIIGGTGLGVYFWHNHQQQQKQTRIAANEQKLAQTNSPSLVMTGNSNNSLSVDTNSQASQLGQVFGVQQNQPTNSSSPESSDPIIDPSKFGEYEKYKDSTSAFYAEIQAGNGATIDVNHKIAVVYKGWLTNGQMFDQSQTDKDGKAKPFVFTYGAHEVIPGWEQAMYGMKVGGTRLLIVPPAVGYGSAGHSPIPPNAVMIFLVQLVAVES